MGIDHGKKIKAPLGKPKIIDKIRKKGEKYPPDAPSPKTRPLGKKPALGSIEEFRKAMGEKKQPQSQTSKPKVREALKKNKQAKESSNKTTITDTQKRGQVRQRYDLFEGRRLPKEPTKKPKFTKKDYKKFSSPGSKDRRKPRNTEKLPRPTQFLPHIIKPLFMYPEGEKPKFLRKKTSGEA